MDSWTRLEEVAGAEDGANSTGGDKNDHETLTRC